MLISLPFRFRTNSEREFREKELLSSRSETLDPRLSAREHHWLPSLAISLREIHSNAHESTLWDPKFWTLWTLPKSGTSFCSFFNKSSFISMKINFQLPSVLKSVQKHQLNIKKSVRTPNFWIRSSKSCSAACSFSYINFPITVQMLNFKWTFTLNFGRRTHLRHCVNGIGIESGEIENKPYVDWNFGNWKLASFELEYCSESVGRVAWRFSVGEYCSKRVVVGESQTRNTWSSSLVLVSQHKPLIVALNSESSHSK